MFHLQLSFHIPAHSNIFCHLVLQVCLSLINFRLLKALDTYSQKLNLDAGKNSMQIQANLAADVWSTSESNVLPLGYGVVFSDNEELSPETIRSYAEWDQVYESDVDVAIFLNAEVIQRIKDAQSK